MYNSNNVAERIKVLARSKKITVKKVLEEVGLGFNTMSNMKNSMPKADNLAKIADCLDCSVDYLLGRTDMPTGYSTNISNVQTTVNSPQVSGNNNTIAETISAEEAELLELIRKLPLRKRMEFILSLYEELEKT